ncbi:hypothetical protein IDJ77_04005 [Mucilaginibacter sp. ZT4R22]|uniref:Response regulator receiver domain-containing protein n=1 Tax=Mucilaginibacter pankratovii TaxID=2772110 RepID=A0ABR7WKW6_9SPHI|nr:hypothetical protein [Mucilaginibacter pankratovii]MBD1362965.1 hypothetical protein [Mucilaginibacter pankratovii]
MKKVLLIENQYLQFKSIRKELQEHYEGEFEIYPLEIGDEETDRKEFEALMDQVRIALNERYGKMENKKSKSVLRTLIKDENFDLLIIDYKLVGYDGAPTGIQLASDFRADNIRCPILFLSRTPDNRSDILTTRGSVSEPYSWASKGYSDHDLLDGGYVNSDVTSKIDALIKLNKLEEVQTILLSLVRSEPMMQLIKTDDVKFFTDRVYRFNFDEGQKKEIMEMEEDPMQDEEIRVRFLNKYRELLKNIS